MLGVIEGTPRQSTSKVFTAYKPWSKCFPSGILFSAKGKYVFLFRIVYFPLFGVLYSVRFQVGFPVCHLLSLLDGILILLTLTTSSNLDCIKTKISMILILPYTDVCRALHTQCFLSVCGKKLHRRFERDSNPWPPAYSCRHLNLSTTELARWRLAGWNPCG